MDDSVDDSNRRFGVRLGRAALASVEVQQGENVAVECGGTKAKRMIMNTSIYSSFLTNT